MAQFLCMNADNAYLYTPDGSVTGHGAWQGGWGGGFEEPYFHFPSVVWDPAIPVTSAFLVGISAGNDIDHTGAVVKSSIYGDKQLTPTVPADDVDYTGRTRTAASIALWDVGTPPDYGTLIVSPDIGAIVAELVGQAGWVSGHDLGFLLPDAGSDVFTDFLWGSDVNRTVTLYVNESPPGPPAVTSFSPDHGDHGSTVIVTGSNFTAATAVTIAGLPMASYVVDGPTQITAVLPELAITGPIAVTTGTGSGTSASDFTVPPSVQITAQVHDLADGVPDGTGPPPCLVKLTETVALLLHAGPTVEAQSGGTPNFSAVTSFYEGRVKPLAVDSTVTVGPSSHLDAASSVFTPNILTAADSTFSSIGNWLSGGSENLSIVTSPTPHGGGTHDLKFVYVSTGSGVDGPFVSSFLTPYSASAGDRLTMTLWVRADPANVTVGAWVTLRFGAGPFTGNARAVVQPTSSGWTELTCSVIAPAAGPVSWTVEASTDQFASSAMPASNDTFYISGDITVSRRTGPNGVQHMTGCRLDDTHALAVYQDTVDQVWAVVVECADPTSAPTVGARQALTGVTFHAPWGSQTVGAEVLGIGPTWAVAHFANAKGYSIVTDGGTTINSATAIDRTYAYQSVPIGIIATDSTHYVLVENISNPDFTWTNCWFTAASATSPPAVDFHPSGANPTVVATGDGPVDQSLLHSDGWNPSAGAFRQVAGLQGVIRTGHYDAGTDTAVLTAATTDAAITATYDPAPLVASFDGGASTFAVLFVNSSSLVVMRAETVNPAGDTLTPRNLSAMPDLTLPFYFAEHFVLSLAGRALAVLPGTGGLIDGLILTPIVAAAPPTITSFSPPSGVPGTVITVLGSGFTDATTVTIGGNPVAFTVISDGALSFNAGGNLGYITVTNPEGTATSALPFTRLRTARASTARLKRMN